MNIFFVDSDPDIAARSLVDKHVVKMILESAQLLSTAHRVIDGELYIDNSSGRKIKRYALPDDRHNVLYSATHANHPSAVWIRQSVENYNWLTDHLFSLMDEYTYRYGKVHKVESSGLGLMIATPPYQLKDWDFTQPALAMPDEFKVPGDAVESYRNYYRFGKKHLHKWSKRPVPSWIS